MQTPQNNYLLNTYKQQAVKYHREGQLPQAKRLYTEALVKDPDNPHLLHYLGLVLFQMGETKSALDFLRKASRFNGSNPEIFYNLGCVLESCGELDEAERAYRKAIDLRPGYAEAEFNLGNLFRQKGIVDRAMESYSNVIEAKADFAEAYLNLGNILKLQNRTAEAENTFQKGLANCPDSHALNFSIARILREQNKIDDSMGYLSKALQINPANTEILNELGILLTKKGEYNKAESYLRKALELAPSFAKAYINLGNVLKEQGKVDQAIRSYRESLEICPESADAINNLGIAFEEKGQIDEAINFYQQAISINPIFCLAHYNLGRALKTSGNLDSAIKSLRQAVELDGRFVPAFNELGVALAEKGNLEEAMAAYHRAIEIDNTSHLAYHNLGNIFQRKERLDEAISYYKKAVEICPDFASSILHLAVVLMNKDDLEAAVSFYEKALQVQPDCDKGRYAAYGLDIHIKAGEWESVKKDLKQLMEHRFTASETDDLRKILFNLCAIDIDSKLIRKKYEEYGKLMEQHYEKITSKFELVDYEQERLRIGYISPDFREHSMGYFARSILEHHDSKEFEIRCYSLSSHEDYITKEIEKLSSKFKRASSLTKKEIARLIYDDKIHILVDLAGHTAGNALEILSMKPAPLLVNHIGHANSTGLRTVDYKLTDYYADREDAATDYVEKLIRIPGCIYPYVNIPAPEKMLRKQDYNIPEEKITFAAFCAIRKLNPRLLSLWKEMLDRVNNSVLLFSPQKIYRKYFLKLASSCGITPERIRFLDTAGNFIMDQCRYNAVDIALDTFPYGGGITSINALNMLVPVVTLKGEKHGERMTYSILSNLGATQTIAGSEDEYISVACRLAEDLEFRSNVKEAIQNGLKYSPLVDMKQHVQYLETAYRKIWQRFAKGKEPAEIRI